jgi:hypothetical protein
MTVFWRAASGRTRTALAVAALALIIHAGGSTGAVGIDDMMVLAPMHLMVMALALWLVASLVRRRLFGSRVPDTRTATAPAPWWLKAATPAAFTYGLALMLWLLWRYGEGGPEETAAGAVWIRDGRATHTLTVAEYQDYQAAAIRMISAWWLTIALAIAWAGHAVVAGNHGTSIGTED